MKPELFREKAVKLIDAELAAAGYILHSCANTEQLLNFDFESGEHNLLLNEAQALLAKAHAVLLASCPNCILQIEDLSGVHLPDKSRMIQRLRVHAFLSSAEQKAFELQREEARRRDHRVLGKDLKLFVADERIGRGLVMLLPRGAALKRVLERWAVDEEIKRGYLHVESPPLANLELYERSGHLAHYRESMFPAMVSGSEQLMLRPVSCPHHFVLFDSSPRSWRDLPVRYAEIAKLFRYENSGEVSGLSRLRNFTLADSHIFCRPEQIADEFRRAVELIVFMLERLGISNKISFRASLRDPARASEYLGDDGVWERAERALLENMDSLGLKYEKALGEAAIYGPKLDMQFCLANGKEETAFTVQIDFISADRFGLGYVEADGSRQAPVVIHRSSIGCFERTIAFLVEHFEGRFPIWLAPVQIVLLPVSEKHVHAAEALSSCLLNAGIRVEVDARNETLSKRIREARMQRVPFWGVLGEQEIQANSIALHDAVNDKKESVNVEQLLDLIGQRCRA